MHMGMRAHAHAANLGLLDGANERRQGRPLPAAPLPNHKQAHARVRARACMRVRACVRACMCAGVRACVYMHVHSSEPSRLLYLTTARALCAVRGVQRRKGRVSAVVPTMVVWWLLPHSPTPLFQPRWEGRGSVGSRLVGRIAVQVPAAQLWCLSHSRWMYLHTDVPPCQNARLPSLVCIRCCCCVQWPLST